MKTNMAFNSDPVVQQEVLKIKNIFNIKCAIETGTYEGNTTLFLANHFDQVYSVDLMENWVKDARNKCSHLNNVVIEQDSSEIFLNRLLPNINQKYENIIFYLDAHWEDYWPLNDELLSIAKFYKNKAVIIIDDFFVPNRSFQFDSYKDKICNFDFIKKEINSCYDNYFYYYLNRTERNLPIRDGTIGGVGKIFAIPNYLLDKFNITKDFFCKEDLGHYYSVV